MARGCIARCEGMLYNNSSKARRSEAETCSTGISEKEEFGLWVLRRIFDPISRFLKLLQVDDHLYQFATFSAHNFFRVLGLFMRTLPLARFFQRVVLPYYCWYMFSRRSDSYCSISGTINARARLLKYDI
ncbi:uncharacterized protein PHACADRAFT_260162 [Phanerochaete carnosa HHB-10118-sp]|uniref:Uncharacterized protein n=1 Tax=Phanerochaete carnosa (strain HHB-10118-sp) TaxID=650164 RepID=K5WTC4_PHACS|nr:uncharacterized protein PHACADRAFT_260162 [Phanerochaete carnosa HHB-10118-sp]EKM53682.1 hypothetical protein PHACADRAFT_260162 [Phanerochaete carnosa HHB-10118-sp]